MEIGLCTSLFGEEIALLNKTGADYAEIGLWQLADRSPREVRERGAQLADRGVFCRAANLLFPGSLRLIGEDADRSAVSAYLENVLEKASLLGLETLVFGSGKAREIPEGVSYGRAWEQLTALCRELIAPAAAARGMVCCIEPLHRAECNFITTCAEGARLVREVDHPAFRLLADLYHFDLEGEPRASLAGYRGLLAHLHIASAKNDRAFPLPGDGEDYAELFVRLREAGFTGRISLEGRPVGEPIPCVKSSVEYLKSFLE